jgi:hypothetical protein
LLGIDEKGAARSARVVSDFMLCQSSLLKQQHTETTPDGSDARLEDVSESTEGVMGEQFGSTQGQDAYRTDDEEAQPAWPMAVGVAISEQTSQSECRLNEGSLNQQQQKLGD